MPRIPLPRPQDLSVQLWDGSECSSREERLCKITSCCSIFILPQWFPCQTCSVYQSKQDISTCQLCQLSLGSGNQAVLSLPWTSSLAKKDSQIRAELDGMWSTHKYNLFWVVLGALGDRYQQGSCAVQILTSKFSPPPGEDGPSLGPFYTSGTPRGERFWGVMPKTHSSTRNGSGKLCFLLFSLFVGTELSTS